MNDDAIRHALKSAIEPERLNAVRRRISLLPRRPYSLAEYPYPPDYEVFSELAQPLKRLLRKQPELISNPMISSGDGALALLNELPGLLVKKAASLGEDAAIAWLKKLLVTKTAIAMQVLPVWGIKPSISIRLTDEISLTRIDELPPSYQLTGLLAPSIAGFPTFAIVPPAAALTRRFKLSPLVLESDRSGPGPQFFPDLHDIRRCLGLVGPGLLTTTQEWTQLLDEDLNALLGCGHMQRWHEIQPFLLKDVQDFNASIAREIVQNYLAMDSAQRPKLNLAISRFDQALRRHSPGDAALELCIALEALLVGDGQGELAWKVSLRAALLAGGTKEEKKINRATIKALYEARSGVVHSGVPPAFVKTVGVKVPIDELVRRGTIVTANVVRAALAARHLPDWFDAELGYPD
jgi:hypothetical protein